MAQMAITAPIVIPAIFPDDMFVGPFCAVAEGTGDAAELLLTVCPVDLDTVGSGALDEVVGGRVN